MSGPIDDFSAQGANRGLTAIEVREGRETNIGRLGILRVLPTKNRRTVGPWCFVDLMRADDVERLPPLEIGPHPHIGLATVTWLFTGTALHSDSLGTEQLIRPGQLNLMTASHGIAHAEEGVDTDQTWESTGTMGVQMWLAQTETTRHGVSATFEHGAVPIDKPIRVEEDIVEPGSLAIVPTGREELRLSARSYPARLMLLGGEPLGDEVKMWWNFVARTTDELTEAWQDWQAGNEERFGPVPSKLERIEAPIPPWIRQDS